jgi:hypothetical protein
MMQQGVYLMQGLSVGLDQGTPTVLNTMERMNTALLAHVIHTDRLNPTGVGLMNEFARSITANAFRPETAMGELGGGILRALAAGAPYSRFVSEGEMMAEGLAAGINAAAGQALAAGESMTSGLAQGIAAGQSALEAQAARTAAAAAAAARNALESKSPSMVFDRIGRDAVLGWIGGAKAMTGELESTMAAIAARMSGASAGAMRPASVGAAVGGGGGGASITINGGIHVEVGGSNATPAQIATAVREELLEMERDLPNLFGRKVGRRL